MTLTKAVRSKLGFKLPCWDHYLECSHEQNFYIFGTSILVCLSFEEIISNEWVTNKNLEVENA